MQWRFKKWRQCCECQGDFVILHMKGMADERPIRINLSPATKVAAPGFQPIVYLRGHHFELNELKLLKFVSAQADIGRVSTRSRDFNRRASGFAALCRSKIAFLCLG